MEFCPSLLRRIFHDFGAHRFRTLKWKAKSTRPDQLREATQSTGHSKQHSVEAHLRHSIILQQQPATSNVMTCHVTPTNYDMSATHSCTLYYKIQIYLICRLMCTVIWLQATQIVMERQSLTDSYCTKCCFKISSLSLLY